VLVDLPADRFGQISVKDVLKCFNVMHLVETPQCSVTDYYANLSILVTLSIWVL